MKIRTDTTSSRQIPSFIRHDHPGFVAFVEAYYKFMEENGYTKRLESLTDIDETLDEFIEYFNGQINHATKIEDYQFDKRLLLKRFKDLYLAKGSEASYRLLMRLLFQKEMEMFYPGEHLFSVDGADWSQSIAINITDIQGGSAFDLQGNNVTLTTPDGEQFVVLVDEVFQISGDEYEIFITRGFIENLPFGTTVTFGDISATVSPTTNSFEILDPGEGFRPGDAFEIVTGTGSGTFIKVKKVDSNGGIEAIQLVKFGTGYNNNFFSELRPETTETEVLPTSVVPDTDEFGDTTWSIETFDEIEGYVDFGVISKQDYWSNEWFANRFYSVGTEIFFGGRLYEVKNSGTSGTTGPTHTSGTVLNGGINLEYLSAGTIEDSNYGPFDYAGTPLSEFYHDSRGIAEDEDSDPARITFFLGIVKTYPGYYKDSSGFLDNFSFLRDDLYWQEYSYVVKITEQLKKYKNQMISMLHPAGVKNFSVYIVEQILDLSPNIEVLEFEKILSTIVLGDTFPTADESFTYTGQFVLSDDMDTVMIDAGASGQVFDADNYDGGETDTAIFTVDITPENESIDTETT